MGTWMYFGVFMALFCIVMYCLFCHGIAVSKSIRAILFMFRTGKDADNVTVDSCSGWVQRVGKFRESCTYELTLSTQLSKGEAEVSLLDKKKRSLLKLGRCFPSGRVELYMDNRYYLRWEFKNATGKCELRWRPCPLVTEGEESK